MDASAAADEVRVVPGGTPYRGAQGLDYTPGVSTETVGASGLWLGAVTIPPGARTTAHRHDHHESAFYVVSGEAEAHYGDRLQHRVVAHAGDYIYIPAGLPHVAVNRTGTPAVVIGARTDASEQESVVLMPELEGLVP